MNQQPFLQDWKDPASFNWTSKFFYDLVFDPTPKPKELLETSNSSVDVRDSALAHVIALRKPEAGNERILLVGGTLSVLVEVNITECLKHLTRRSFYCHT
jgi:hypothetical protein